MEDTEVEEGEASCYFEDDSNIDPDIALSYIDEKLQNVLGHFQKDFEGGVSAENLGAKFGGYGSFLPTYQRSPSVRPQPKTPQRVQNFSSPKSPYVLPVEGGPHNSTAPSDAAPSLRIGTATCGLPSLHDARALPVYVSTKQDSCLASVQVNEKFPLKLECVSNKPAKQDSCLSSGQVTEKLPMRHEPVSNKPVNPTEHRTLKVRIKVGSDNKARKNAAIYSGLGLISPSSSMGNSPSLEESGGMPSECQVSLEESPDNILGIMTSFPVPGGLPLSPLHESLLCLERKEKNSRGIDLVPAIKCGEEHPAVLANDSSSSMENKKVPKEKKTKIQEKTHKLVVLKREVGTNFDDNGSTLVKREVARNVELETLGWKQGFSNDTKLKPLSNYECHVLEVDMDGIEDRSPIDLVRNECFQSISDREGGKYEKAKARSSSIEKICESRLKSTLMDISTDVTKNDLSRSDKVSAPLKADSDVSMSKRDPNIGAADKSAQKVGQTAANYVEDEIRMPNGVGKASFGGKNKSREKKSSGKQGLEVDGSLMVEVHEVPKDNKKAGKMHKSKLQKDIQKTRDDSKDVLHETRVEQMNNEIDSLERPFVDRTKDSNLQAVGRKHYASLEKPKEVLCTTKTVDNLTSETILNDAANDGRPSAEGVTSEMEHTSVDPMVIEEDWVCCDLCQKWRLLPYGTKPDQLPEKWLCSMLNWLHGMNHCDFSEEETTNALNALYQLPLPQSQNHLQNHVAGTAAGAADAFHFDQSHPNLSSHAMPNPRKKKQKSKGTPHAATNGGTVQISGSTNNIRQEVVKRRSLNDMQQPILESKLMSNSNVEHLSKSGNFPMDKIIHKQKEKHAVSRDSKLDKLINKREADPYGYEATKKIKADVAFGNDKSSTIAHNGNIDKIGLGLPSKAAVKRIGKHDEKGSSKDVKSGWNGKVRISAKKLGDHASASLQTGSLDMETNDERRIAPKKRKLKDWQENQNYDVTPRNNGNHVPESKVFLKESSDCELRKGKKCRVSGTEGKESSTSKGDARSNTKNKVAKTLLSSNKENPVQGREEVKNIEKDQLPRIYRIKVASNKPVSDEMDPLKRDLGSEQLSRTATSSSSKVSDSRKSRTHFPDVRGSPVESVSSSPMRMSSIAFARKGILGNDAVRSGDFPEMDSPRKSFDGEANVESDRSGTARRGKVSGVFHSESLGFPVLDFRENNACQDFGEKCKSSVEHPPEFQRVKVKVCDPPREMEALNLKHDLKDEVETGTQNLALLHEGSSDLDRLKPVKDERSGMRGSDGEDAKRSDPALLKLRGGNLQVFPPHARKQGNAFDVVPVGNSSNDDLLNRCVFKDVLSPVRKDGSSHLASNALKEAEDLRCVADRLKDSEFGFECNEAYFQAALKFLYGASLLETCNGDISKHAEMSPMQIYSRCAKYCGDCAHEYEKRKEMAAAALAYKCMEVAYMRIVYCKNSSTNRDRQDLQTSLQMVPQGESPSSSVSDVDNLNNQAMVDKTAISKGLVPHAGNHVIVAHNQHNFLRLLDFTKDVNSAMEASRKCQTAFAAANGILEEAQNKEGIISVKRVIDFSFQDIEELIRLVRHAIGAISCQGLGGSKD
ncbi:cysteine-tryptophan domain-containing zinc finger protein 3-like isoform X1 [Rhododendron vialii]|uniref:cysteine-tryptophan domain-containing zinc finger protein 3-like isoform X1 n=1 Tax=Rhododendron vialii TaxID=182163 RepID=UPI00265F5AF1|nr:cysteine-tryptophan domain-containing zinc finger protein 3-like isoform X1 [Rhododendron vialii]